MRKGFTIIELLVASLLLGMLVTILTMVFNQSSIAWRTGVAKTYGMDTVRENIAELREEADNAFIWNEKLYRHTGLWDQYGNLRNRSCDDPNSSEAANFQALMLGGSGRTGQSTWFNGGLSNLEPEDFKVGSVGASGSSGSSGKGGNSSGSGGSAANYTVNVKSAGPDRQFDTWDDIWSWPDDFE